MEKASLNVTAATERAELYFMGRPGSPSAVRRPRLVYRSGTWTALLGDSIDSGIAGSGKSVEEALNAFDTRYLDALHPPKADEQARFSISARRLCSRAALNSVWTSNGIEGTGTVC